MDCDSSKEAIAVDKSYDSNVSVHAMGEYLKAVRADAAKGRRTSNPGSVSMNSATEY